MVMAGPLAEPMHKDAAAPFVYRPLSAPEAAMADESCPEKTCTAETILDGLARVRLPMLPR